MTKIELNKKIEELAKEWFYLIDRKNSNKIIQNIVDLCDPYLQEYPRDTDIWIKLALAVYTTSYADDIKATECMNAILSYDPLNPYALIILGYMESNSWHGITDATFERLCSIQVDDNEVMSMIELVKAWYYSEHNNDELYRKTLESSVALCQKHVRNCVNLGGLYIRQGRIHEGEKLQALALNNIKVKYIYPNNTKYFSITDLDEFFNERIKGTSVVADDEDQKTIEIQH
ncbi:MAG: hypothetical protein M1114_01915 [Candidatus Dependentiae bacterium]|nr:hypothetical protein [Candidatus Dependentiae bacterium]